MRQQRGSMPDETDAIEFLDGFIPWRSIMDRFSSARQAKNRLGGDPLPS
jgi:hypothetical protein